MARRLSAAHKKAISLALRRVKGKTTGLDPYEAKPKAPKKPAAPKQPTRASAGSGKKTAAKKTAGKKPAPAKAPAKKTAAKKPAAKAPARKNVLPAPDNSPMPKKKTAATNRPTPKAESPSQARKADAAFKANREARRDSTPFGSIRNSMAEAQLINGRKSDRERDEDLAEAIQRDSKLTGAEATAKRNAGTAAQLNAAKRRKAALREKELANRAVRPSTRAEQDEISRKYGGAETQQFTDGTPGTWVSVAEAPNMAREGDTVYGTGESEFFKGEMKIVGNPYVEDDGMAYVEVAKSNGSMELARADMEGNVLDDEGNVVASSTKPKRKESGTRIPNARELPKAERTVRPTTSAEQDEISRKYGSAETQQFSDGTPGTWVSPAEAPNMAREGDTVHGTGKSKFFKGEMKIVGNPYVEDDGYAYVEVAKSNGSMELARADMEGNVLDDEGNVVASPAKPKRKESGTRIPNARELPKSNKAAPLKPGPVPKDRMENMARAGDKIKGNGTDDEFFKGTFNVASDPYMESDGNIYVEIQRGNHSVEAVRTDADGNIFDDEDNLVAVRVTEGGTKIKRTSSRGRGKSAKRSDAPDPRVSGFNVDGLW